MLANHRPSILHRPRKAATQNNVENGPIEQEKREEYWKGKSERYADTEDRIRRSLYPDKESKQRDQSVVREVMDQQLQEIHCRRATELQEKAASFMPDHMTADHPWAHTADGMQQNITDIRRQMAREAMEENQRLVYLRREQARQVEVAEKERTKQAVESEDGWWNYGAASERWVPPEHRVKHYPGAPVAAERSSRGAPYAWTDGAKRAAAPAPAPLPSKKYPWSWDE